MPEEKFDSSEDNARGRDHGGRGRGRGAARGKRALMDNLYSAEECIGAVRICVTVLSTSLHILSIHYTGGRKGLLPTPDEFPHFEGGRMDGNREPGENILLYARLTTIKCCCPFYFPVAA